MLLKYGGERLIPTENNDCEKLIIGSLLINIASNI